MELLLGCKKAIASKTLNGKENVFCMAHDNCRDSGVEFQELNERNGDSWLPYLDAVLSPSARNIWMQ